MKSLPLTIIWSAKYRWLFSTEDTESNDAEDMNYQSFLRHMKHDKKVAAGTIRFIIPQGIGKAVVTSDVEQKLLKQLLD